jgi:type II secretory pathway pseudopilin PulG
MARSHLHRRSGFKALELVVVIAIVGAMVALIAPTVMKAREQANRTVCANNLKQIGLAIHDYAGKTNGRLPPMLDYVEGGNGWSPFFYSLYPHMGQVELHKQAAGFDAGWANGVHNTPVPLLLCPSDPTHANGLSPSGWAATSYAPSYKMFGMKTTKDKAGRFITESRYKIGNIPDGTSNTIGLVERYAGFPYFGWSSAAVHPMDGAHWGWNGGGAVYGVWGTWLPQIQPPLNEWWGSIQPANPYYPSTGHRACFVLQMDASVRAVDGTLSQKDWEDRFGPDTRPWVGHGEW